MSEAGGSPAAAHAWPAPQPFDEELRDAEEKYWAERSTSTLSWFNSASPGLKKGEPRPGVIAVKNTSTQALYVVVCTGRESLFPTAFSVKHMVGTSVRADLGVTAAFPTPSATAGGGINHDSSSESDASFEARPDEEPRVITAQRVPKAKTKQLIGIGSIRNVYLHIFFSYNIPENGRWGKKLKAIPIVPFSYYYRITDSELEFCKDAAFDDESVSGKLPAPV